MNGIRFEYGGGDQRLIDAIGKAVEILGSKNFRAVIEARETKFYYTQRSCLDIARTIFECDVTIKITMFSRRPRFGRIKTAYVDPNIADTIFFNTYAVGRGAKANINTLVHETVHVIDKFHDSITGFDFTHNGNKPDDPPQNRDSAPYWIGNRSEDMMELLQERTKGLTGAAALDELEWEDVEAALSEENWAEDEHFYCGTHDAQAE